MHQRQQTTATLAQLLERVDEAAARHGERIEDWLHRQLKADQEKPHTPVYEEDEAEILALVIRHFRAMNLGFSEQRSLAEALLETIDLGNPKDVDLGQPRRRYRLRRRSNTLSIRLGEGHVSLSLPYAIRLITAFDAGGQHQKSPKAAA